MGMRKVLGYGIIALLGAGCMRITPVELDETSQTSAQSRCQAAAQSCALGINSSGFNSFLSVASDGSSDEKANVICDQTQLEAIDSSINVYSNLSLHYILGSSITPDSNFTGIRGPSAADYVSAWNRANPNQILFLAEGSEDYNVGFSGTLEGCGKTIESMMFLGGSIKTTVGFFNTLAPGATIRNLIFDAPMISGSEINVGILAGNAHDLLNDLNGAKGPITLENISILSPTLMGVGAYAGNLLGRVEFYNSQNELHISNVQVTDATLDFITPTVLTPMTPKEFMPGIAKVGGLIGSYYNEGSGGISAWDQILVKNLQIIDHTTLSDFGPSAISLLAGEIFVDSDSQLNLSNVEVSGEINVNPNAWSIGAMIGYLQQYGKGSEISLTDSKASGTLQGKRTWAVGLIGLASLYGDKDSALTLNRIESDLTIKDTAAGGALSQLLAAVYAENQKINITEISLKGSIIDQGLESASFGNSYALGSLCGECDLSLTQLTATHIRSNVSIESSEAKGVGGIIGFATLNGTFDFSDILFKGTVHAKTFNNQECGTDLCAGLSPSGSIGSMFGYLKTYGTIHFTLEQSSFLGSFILDQQSYDFGAFVGQFYNNAKDGSSIQFKDLVAAFNLGVGDAFSGGLGAFSAFLNSSLFTEFTHIVSFIAPTIGSSTSTPSFGFFGKGVALGSPSLSGVYYAQDLWNPGLLQSRGFLIPDTDAQTASSSVEMLGTKIYSDFSPQIWSIQENTLPTIPINLKE